jgi:mono/diheme cytochrome c family protein
LRHLILTLLSAFALVGVPARAFAHEVPPRVTVQSWVRIEGRVVRMLVRVPLEAMRDVEFPLRDRVYLDLASADSTLRDAARLWVADAVHLSADGVTLSSAQIRAVRASLPSDRAFDRYADALATVTGPALALSTDIPVAQTMLDVLLEWPIADSTAHLAITPAFAHLGLRTTTVIRFIAANAVERAFVYDGDQGEVQLDPAWWHAAMRFVGMGAEHLLDGIDHLLFLLCLVLPVRRIRPLIGIVTAFTIAHSITLAASAFGFAPSALWFPPLVEVLIAASIVYMAIENIVGAKLERRWLVAFGFGLVHGFGFSFALRESMQFAGAHLITALAAFNVGIELAQLGVIAIAVPMLGWVFQRVVAERPGEIIGSVIIAHTAWHWMTERVDALRTYRFEWPAFDAALAVASMRLLMGVLIVGGTAWALSGVMTRLATSRPRGTASLLALGAGLLMWAISPRVVLAQGPSRSTMAGVYTADQAVKGREVFTGLCSGCHTVASHSGAVFATRWQGRPLWEFFDYVSRLMPKSAPGTLSEDEYVWVTAYVLKINGMPPSGRELSAEPSLLKAIRIDTTTTNATRAGAPKGPGSPR